MLKAICEKIEGFVDGIEGADIGIFW